MTGRGTTPTSGPGAGDEALPPPDLVPLVYRQLHALAQQLMAQERADHTLAPTALVHEAYARLAHDLERRWNGPGQFYMAAAESMRRILIDHARKRGAVKRGGDWTREPFDSINLASDECCGRVLALDDAFLRLAQEDARAADVVRLRVYAGLTVDQTALALGQSRRTVLRDWEFARAWILQDLEQRGEP
jgi:RNA polymerase sigma factor (TIGR02999 family)